MNRRRFLLAPNLEFLAEFFIFGRTEKPSKRNLKMPKKRPVVKNIDDPIWKSILEQTFSHFLTFFFPNANEVFDLDREFEYLDKEFETLFPPESNNKGVRYVNKLVKVHLKEG